MGRGVFLNKENRGSMVWIVKSFSGAGQKNVPAKRCLNLCSQDLLREEER